MKSLREKEKEKRHFTDFYSSSPRYKDQLLQKRIKNLAWEAAELTLHERPIGIPTFLKTIN